MNGAPIVRHIPGPAVLKRSLGSVWPQLGTETIPQLSGPQLHHSKDPSRPSQLMIIDDT